MAKAANQVIVGLTIGAVAEALALARAAGVDPAKVREALLGGFASSRVLELHGRRMIEGDFRPGGRATTQRKDLAQALELAGQLGLELPATELCLQLYERLIAQGDGELDHSALIRVLERTART
ncbi:MAG TPA: NAD-binding protein [Candidatus Competibacteraceae bacterium]|nr:NAD-binding protein [Candidatus Competibacteraceae bacterium]